MARCCAVRQAQHAPADAVTVTALGNEGTESAPQAGAYHAADKVLWDKIYFYMDRYALSPTSLTRLSEFITFVKARGYTLVSIVGHTDGQKSPHSAWVLSKQRADAVFAVLAPALPSVTFAVVAKADTQPARKEKSATDKAANRRVELFVR